MPAALPGTAVPRIRATWYAGGDSWYGEAWTMLHLPYTAMVLSFVTIGAALAPTFLTSTLAITLVAYFLGLGIGAHFLDQVPGMGSSYTRHWPSGALWAVGLAALLLAAGIGIYGALTSVGPGLLVLVGIQVLCAAGYALAPIFGGVLHRDSIFALSWGALPVLTGFYAQNPSIDPTVLLAALGCAAVALLEIRLSRVSRGLRRQAAQGELPGSSGPEYRRADRALQLLAYATILTGAVVLIGRLATGGG